MCQRFLFYCLAPETPLIREMPMGPKVFLALSDPCVGFGPAKRPTLKTALCHSSLVVGRKTNT